MSAIVVLLVSKLQKLYITEVKSTSLLSTKPPKTQKCRFYNGKTDIFDECNSSTTSKQTSIYAFYRGKIAIFADFQAPQDAKFSRKSSHGGYMGAMSGQMRVSSAICFGSWPKIPASYRGMLGYDAVILRLQPQDNPSYSTPFPRNLVCWLEPPLSHPPRTPQHAPNSPPTAQTRANRQHQHQPTAQQTQQQPKVQNMQIP